MRKILVFIALTFVTITGVMPVAAVAAVSDTSDGCPVGYEMQTVLDPSGLGQDTACVPAGTVTGPIGTPNTLAQATSGVPVKVDPDVCSLNPIYFSLDTCMKSFMSWIGSWWLTLGGGILRLAGTLFDTLVYRVIVDFKHTLEFLNIESAISTGWTVFRDFSNILIIGFFVFISISIILGLEEFGQKKLIARVLIIAVLINFSLLFTKIIIDTSNFTAFQIYRQMAGGAQVANFDIAQGFLNPMGIDKIWDTQKVTDLVKTNSGSGLQAFFFGFVGGLMLMAVAGVLLYGCFLIVARGVLFIFLMLTAALAFATYLIPSLEHGEYGWSAWWKSLFNSAIFAPLLMLFLFVSLTIVNAAGRQLGGTTSSGAATLGSVISDPQSQLTTSAWAVIMLYMLGTGLLFLSMKMSSKFAGKISGFSLAAAIPALGLAAGARFAGFAGRNAIGRPALAVSERMKKASQDTSRSNFSRQLYDFGAQRFKGVAKRDFNAMRTPLGAGVAGLTSLKADTLAGKKIGGAVGAEEHRAAKIAEQANRMTSSDAQKKEIEKAIASEIKNSPALSEAHQKATETHAEAQSSESAEKTQLVNLNRQHNEEMARLQSQLEEAQRTGDEAEISAAQGRVADARTKQARAIDEQTERIKKAASTVTQAEAGIGKVRSRAQTIADIEGRLPKTQSAQDLAHDMALSQFTNRFFTQEENERLAHHAVDDVKKESRKKKLKDSGLADAFKDIVGSDDSGHGGAPAAPAAPKPPASGGEAAHGHDH